jgi:hypothetical protein
MLNRTVLSPVGRRIVRSSHRVSRAVPEACYMSAPCSRTYPDAHVMSAQFVDCKIYLASDHRCAYTEEASPYPKIRLLHRRGNCYLLRWSTFVAFKNKTYHEFFTLNVPGGTSAVQYAEDHNWDTITTKDAINSAKSVGDTVQQFVYIPIA